ncbi:hypothetical protein LAV84_18430 [Rhizobium sp. VS19-DR104.2]|uniref:hypothetical protein n=2 Tax=unclassified Rhizobium TaxID=2613769 RepID=UPI001CCC69FB|nr:MULTISPECIES: hypothetical protein [unclassified Rhizobium]MBZ5775047.1 hypothetical protein [Rhizobium sp. VS19-DRK62.2]MBZ5831699.1 hypothetical protein [Rhizobium sp. VS19-DR104.2]
MSRQPRAKTPSRSPSTDQSSFFVSRVTMSISAIISSKTAAKLEKEGVKLGVSSRAVARAIIETVASENLTQTILAGIDVKAMEPRGKHRHYARIDYRGGSYSVDELASMTGIAPSTIRNRLSRGMPIERVLSGSDLRRAGA